MNILEYLLGLGLDFNKCLEIYNAWQGGTVPEKAVSICCIINAEYENLGQEGFEAKYGCTDPADWQSQNQEISQYYTESQNCAMILDDVGLDSIVPSSWRS